MKINNVHIVISQALSMNRRRGQ